MKAIDKIILKNLMNDYGKRKKPFYFITDYLAKNNLFIPKEEIDQTGIEFLINHTAPPLPRNYIFNTQPISKDQYLKGYNIVSNHLKKGNSFLVNYTQPSSVITDLSLQEIFKHASAPFKLLFKDQYVVFSPERFIKIKNNVITAYPMKGTINADIPNAREKLLNSKKENAEHATIVDLLRNDMSIHAKDVQVKRFKYLDKIQTKHHSIYQMSSEIIGDVTSVFPDKVGDIITDMLPAGSITGAPKTKTLEVIEEAENYKRGYYTGVAGYFDGENLDSFVMIRFIEKTKDRYIYKSGGGITFMSNPEEEYQELKEKIYVPFY